MIDNIDWPLFWGLGGVIIGFLFLYWHRNVNRYLWLLQSLKEYHVNDELYEEVSSAGGTLPYIALIGKVSADERVLHGIYDREAEGVIRNVVIKEHKSRWDSKTRSWCDGNQIVSSEWEVTPFSLISTDKTEGLRNHIRVNVKEPRCAYNKLELSTLAVDFKPAAAPGLFGHIIDYFAGQSDGGVQTIEGMLLKNTTCTIVGELTLTDGKLVIKPPSWGELRYYIWCHASSGGIERIIDKEKIVLDKNWKYFAFTCFLVASMFIQIWLCKCWVNYSENGGYTGFMLNEGWKFLAYFHFWIVACVIFSLLCNENETLDFSSNENIDSKHEEKVENIECMDFSNNIVDRNNALVCSICLIKPRDVVFLPCGHVCACSECGGRVQLCPICRRSVKRRSAVFFS